MSGTKSGQEGKQNFNVFCLLTGETYACKTHQKYSVWFCKSFLWRFFPCTCRGGGRGAEGGVLSTMTGRVTRLHQLFTIRHVLSNKGQWRQGEEVGYWHFTDLVLKQYFTNDLLNLNIHHHKRHWSKMRKRGLLDPQSFGGRGAKGRESINLNARDHKPNSVTLSPANGLQVSTFFKDEGWRQSNELKWQEVHQGLENLRRAS